MAEGRSFRPGPVNTRKLHLSHCDEMGFAVPVILQIKLETKPIFVAPGIVKLFLGGGGE